MPNPNISASGESVSGEQKRIRGGPRTVNSKVKGEHPEDRCDRCGRENVQSWHAPSPLWNAVAQRLVEAGGYAYPVLCPPCFAQLAEAIVGGVVWCFKPHGVDAGGLWSDADGREWSEARCLWVDRELAVDPSRSTPEEVDPVAVREQQEEIERLRDSASEYESERNEAGARVIGLEAALRSSSLTEAEVQFLYGLPLSPACIPKCQKELDRICEKSWPRSRSIPSDSDPK